MNGAIFESLVMAAYLEYMFKLNYIYNLLFQLMYLICETYGNHN